MTLVRTIVSPHYQSAKLVLTRGRGALPRRSVHVIRIPGGGAQGAALQIKTAVTEYYHCATMPANEVASPDGPLPGSGRRYPRVPSASHHSHGDHPLVCLSGATIHIRDGEGSVLDFEERRVADAPYL